MFFFKWLAYTVYIDGCFLMLSINIHVGLNICSFMLRQVCTIEPLFFETTSGIYRRPFEGRHLVMLGLFSYVILINPFRYGGS